MNTEFDQSDNDLEPYPFPKSRIEYARFFFGLEAASRKPDLSFDAEEVFRWNAELEAKVRRAHLRLFWKVFAVVFCLWTVFGVALLIAYKDAGFIAFRVAIMLTGNVFSAACIGYFYVAILGSFPLDENGRILPWEVVPKDGASDPQPIRPIRH